jgi:predicted methyltransferase
MNHKILLVAGLAAGLLLSACGREQPTETESAPAADPAQQQQEAPVEPAPAERDVTMDDTSNDVPDALASAVADPDRPAEDRARDEDRRPAEVLTFFGVEPGMTVLEFVAGGGYYTEILSRAVGYDGHVYATRLNEQRIADDRLPNVTAVADRGWDLEPDSVDMVFTALNYHDLFNIEDLDRRALLSEFYDALKPGGTFAVIDHAAEEGSGTRDTSTLHRIDEAVVVEDITAAGFELTDDSPVLRHRDDDRTQGVFAEGLRGKTDRFVLKFTKPAE